LSLPSDIINAKLIQMDGLFYGYNDLSDNKFAESGYSGDEYAKLTLNLKQLVN